MLLFICAVDWLSPSFFCGRIMTKFLVFFQIFFCLITGNVCVCVCVLWYRYCISKAILIILTSYYFSIDVSVILLLRVMSHWFINIDFLHYFLYMACWKRYDSFWFFSFSFFLRYWRYFIFLDCLLFFFS